MLFLLLFLATLHAASDESNPQENVEQRVVISSPERCLAPERGYIACDKFLMLFVRPYFASAMYSTYADPDVMQYLDNGSTYESSHVNQQFLTRAKEMLSSNEAPYYWCIIGREGIYGIANVWPVEEKPGTLEVARMLTKTAQNKKFGSHIFELLFSHFSNHSWYVTSHPDNKLSQRSQENAGFVYQKTEHVEQYNGLRNFYERPSNAELEGRKKIRFTYSGKVVSLGELE